MESSSKPFILHLKSLKGTSSCCLKVFWGKFQATGAENQKDLLPISQNRKHNCVLVTQRVLFSTFLFNKNTEVCWEENKNCRINKGIPVYKLAVCQAGHPTQEYSHKVYSIL